jgi:hypothetical protein
MDVRGTAIAVARAQRQQALAIAARMRYLSRRRPVPLAGRSQKVEKMRTFVAALICSLCAAVAGCSAIGELDIKRVTPDGPSGYLKRPLQLTVSTQDSLLHFAHGICQDVMPGSSAQITFVRKVTGLNDWEIYRYDCEGHGGATAPLAGSTGGPTGADAMRSQQQSLACVKSIDAHHACMDNCMINATSPFAGMALDECMRRCMPNLPPGCS